MTLSFLLLGCGVCTNQTGVFTLSVNTDIQIVSEDKDNNSLLEDMPEAGVIARYDVGFKEEIQSLCSNELYVTNIQGIQVNGKLEKEAWKIKEKDKEKEGSAEQVSKQEVNMKEEDNKEQEDNKEEKVKEEPEIDQQCMVTLLAVGDNLLHQKVIDSGKMKDGKYNFDHLFKQLSEDIKAADIAVINQETILGTKKMGYSGYPRFCSPTAVGHSITKAGFDIVLHANNHTMDRGVEGILTTLNYWERYPKITPLGIYGSTEDANQIAYIEKNGITFAFLNYTYGLNGNTLPLSKSYLVNMMDKNKLKAHLKEARKKADFVIVFPHWGSEYVYKANKYQKEYATFFNEQGVDLIIGSHPHVLQPIEWFEGKNGHKTLVYYSLGNYISSMDYTDRMLGGIANVTIVKDREKTYIKKASITPIVTHYERGGNHNFTVYKLSDYTQKLASRHYILKGKWGKDFSLKTLEKLANDIVGDFIEKRSKNVN